MKWKRPLYIDWKDGSIASGSLARLHLHIKRHLHGFLNIPDELWCHCRYCVHILWRDRVTSGSHVCRIRHEPTLLKLGTYQIVRSFFLFQKGEKGRRLAFGGGLSLSLSFSLSFIRRPVWHCTVGDTLTVRCRRRRDGSFFGYTLEFFFRFFSNEHRCFLFLLLLFYCINHAWSRAVATA